MGFLDVGTMEDVTALRYPFMSHLVAAIKLRVGQRGRSMLDARTLVQGVRLRG